MDNHTDITLNSSFIIENKKIILNGIKPEDHTQLFSLRKRKQRHFERNYKKNI